MHKSLFLFILALDSCTDTIPPPNPPVITDYDKCGIACENLTKLNCLESKPIKTKQKCKVNSECSQYDICENGFCLASCTTICIETEKNGIALNPNCIARITKCEQVETQCVVK